MQSRCLRYESLESRRLLTADLTAAHNFLIPEDVDGNGAVTPIDALRGINHLARGVATEAVDFLDVNADGRLTPIDPLVVLNKIARGNAESNVPSANRIARLREAIENGQLPPGFERERAQEILQTLKLGGRPELGEVITPRTLHELRQTLAEGEPVVDAVFATLGIRSTGDVVDQVESTLQSFGIDISDVVTTVQSVIDALPEEPQAASEQIVDIVNQLGNQGTNLGTRLSELLNSADVQAIADRVVSIVNQANIDVDAIQQQVNSLLAAIADDGLSFADALNDLLDRPIDNGTSLRDEIVGLLRSEELDRVRQQVESRLADVNIDLSRVRSRIDRFADRLANGETPIRDWVAGFVTTARDSGPSARLFAEGELLDEEIDQLVDSVVENGTAIGRAVDDLVLDLTDGTMTVRQLVDDILDSVRSHDGSDIRSLVDRVLGDVDSFLDNLFNGNDFLDSLLERIF